MCIAALLFPLPMRAQPIVIDGVVDVGVPCKAGNNNNNIDATTTESDSIRCPRDAQHNIRVGISI